MRKKSSFNFLSKILKIMSIANHYEQNLNNCIEIFFNYLERKISIPMNYLFFRSLCYI